MNPGNGIETLIDNSFESILVSFLFMNPGNGIETRYFYLIPRMGIKKFLIYESRQRD